MSVDKSGDLLRRYREAVAALPSGYTGFFLALGCLLMIIYIIMYCKYNVMESDGESEAEETQPLVVREWILYDAIIEMEL
jgi:hypothetical protein